MSRTATGLGHDPAYDTPGDLRSILRTLKLVGVSVVALLVAAAIRLPVPGLWAELTLFLWVAVIIGGLVGGWRAASAVLVVLIGTLFNLPLIQGQGGARYVVSEVGARVLAAAAAAWMAGWLLQRKSLGTSLVAQAASFVLATGLATGILFWLQRGALATALPVTLAGLALTTIPATLAFRYGADRSRSIRGARAGSRGAGSS